MKIYNKLVRDKIPDIIAECGKKSEYHFLSDTEYLVELDRKLDEECSEYHSDKSLDELADMLEVIYAIAKAKGCSQSELENIRIEKRLKRGGFEQKIFLQKAEE